MSKVLMFRDDDANEVVCLETTDMPYEPLQDFGRHLSDWEEDLGMYDDDKGHGLYIWEGEVTENKDETYDWTGEVRRPTTEELQRLVTGERMWEL